MQIILVAIASWLAGVAAYFGALVLVYREPFSWSGDTMAVLFWSALVFAATFLVVYLPILLVMRRLLNGVHPLWPFPLVAAALGLVPIVLIALFNGGDLRSLISHEALLFGVMFAAIGLVAGVGFVLVHRDATAA